MMKRLVGEKRGAIAIMAVWIMVGFTALAALTVQGSYIYLTQIRDQRSSDIMTAGAAIAIGGHMSPGATTSAVQATAQSQALTAATNLRTLNAATSSIVGTPSVPAPTRTCYTVAGSVYTPAPCSNSVAKVVAEGTVQISINEAQNVSLLKALKFLLPASNPATSYTVGSSTTAEYYASQFFSTTSSTTTTTSVGGGYCGAALGSGGIQVSGGSVLQSGSSATTATCSIAANGAISDTGGSRITENTITSTSTVTSSGGSSINANTITQNGSAITDFVGSQTQTAAEITALGNVSSTVTNPSSPAAAPSCTKTIATITMNGYTAPTSGDSTNSFNYYKPAGDGVHSGWLYYLIESPPAGSVYCYNGLVINGHTSVAFAPQSGGYGTFVIKSVSTSTDTNYATFPTATYYFTSGSGLSLGYGTNYTFYPGTYYFTSNFDDGNGSITESLFYDPSNTGATGTYYFMGGLQTDSVTANFGAGNYYVSNGLNFGSGNITFGGPAGTTSTPNANVTNFQIGGAVQLNGTNTFNGTGNWTVNGNLNFGGGGTTNFGCRETASLSCIYSIKGNVDLTGGSSQVYGNDTFLINGTLTFEGGDSGTSYSGTSLSTGVSFFATGNITLSGGPNLNLNANLLDGSGTSAVILGTTSTSSTAAITVSGGSNTKLNGVIYAPNGTINVSGGAQSTTTANACLQYVASALVFSGGTSTTTTCTGFEGTTSTTSGGSGGGSSNQQANSSSTTSGSTTSTAASSSFARIIQ